MALSKLGTSETVSGLPLTSASEICDILSGETVVGGVEVNEAGAFEEASMDVSVGALTALTKLESELRSPRASSAIATIAAIAAVSQGDQRGK